MLWIFVLDRYGRVVDSPGDNILVEFASVVDAVQDLVQARYLMILMRVMLMVGGFAIPIILTGWKEIAC
jgi:hypothetical protein